MIRVDVWLPDPAGALAVGAFGAGALIRIERADLDLSPPYDLGSYAEVDTIPIVGTSLQYQWWDPDGIATSSYRWRLSNAGDTVDSDYSAPFAGSNPAGSVLAVSYASLDRVIALFETKPNVARLRRLAIALGVATDELVQELGGRDYFRHPTFGTQTWSPSPDDIDGRVLHTHDGLVVLDTVTVDDVAITDYVLRGTGPHETYPAGIGEPAFHVELTNLRWPRDPARIALTGATGWPAIPEALAESAAARARQLVYADPSYAGNIPGPPDYTSGATPSERWPQVLYRFMQREKSRFDACQFGNERGFPLTNEPRGWWIG